MSPSLSGCFQKIFESSFPFAHRHHDERHQDADPRPLPFSTTMTTRNTFSVNPFWNGRPDIPRVQCASAPTSVDRRRDQASRGFAFDKANRLADDLGVNLFLTLLPSLPHVLDLCHTQYSDALRDIKKEYRPRKNSPHVMDPGRKKTLEIDRITVRKMSASARVETDNGRR